MSDIAVIIKEFKRKTESFTLEIWNAFLKNVFNRTELPAIFYIVHQASPADSYEWFTWVRLLMFNIQQKCVIMATSGLWHLFLIYGNV